MNLLLTHPGTQYAPALAAQLHKLGLLQRFATGIAFAGEGSDLLRSAAELLLGKRTVQKRLLPSIPAGKLERFVFQEALAVFRHQVLKRGNDEVFDERNRRFQEWIKNEWINEADSVIGFDTSSSILARRCRELHKPFFLDASIAHPLKKEEVYALLRARYPQWAEGLQPKRPGMIEREQEEMALATHIVAASSFSINSYTANGVERNKLSLNAYGVNLQAFTSKWGGAARPVPGKGALRFFFLGAYNARKGFPWLCDMWEELHRHYPQAKLFAAGYGECPAGFKIPAGITMLNALHPADRLAHLHAADVFVFPSFFEGFGQTIIEAMAAGLPVITTTHTCAPDVMEQGREGFFSAPGDSAAFMNHMQTMLVQPELVERMGREAAATAQRYSWDAYGERWKEILLRYS